jgi:hypothetical protein
MHAALGSPQSRRFSLRDADVPNEVGRLPACQCTPILLVPPPRSPEMIQGGAAAGRDRSSAKLGASTFMWPDSRLSLGGERPPSAIPPCDAAPARGARGPVQRTLRRCTRGLCRSREPLPMGRHRDNSFDRRNRRKRCCRVAQAPQGLRTSSTPPPPNTSSTE